MGEWNRHSSLCWVYDEFLLESLNVIKWLNFLTNEIGLSLEEMETFTSNLLSAVNFIISLDNGHSADNQSQWEPDPVFW